MVKKTKTSAVLSKKKNPPLGADPTAPSTGVDGVQVYPGCYSVQNTGGVEYGVMLCTKVGTKYYEYYGVSTMVGGAGSNVGEVVMKLVWLGVDHFADINALITYCNSKGYSIHIKATCLDNAF